jgi:hypothetical protein
MPAKRRRTQLQRIQLQRIQRIRQRQRVGKGITPNTRARGSAKSSGRSGISGRYVVRQHEGTSGGVKYRVTQYKSGAREPDQKPTPRTGIFDFSDPTLAHRAEEELHRTDR